MPPVDSTPPLVPGYLLGARLGTGAAGSVWRATPLGGGPVRAVKVVRTGPGSDREIAALVALRHPHLVTLHDSVALDDGRTALVLDLVDGGSLGSVVAERGHLSPGEVVTVLAPLAQALADLHADGLQHGDLAPGNVLLDRDGRPVLADVGTARVTGEPRDEVFGTAGYVDPVVLTGGPASPASDVYGLGALGWLALTGSPPPSPAQRPALVDLVPAAPAELVAAVQSAVDPDPARRPDPADLAHRLLLSCRARPVWASGEGPEMGGLTHRIRALAAVEAGAEAGRRHRAERRKILRRAAPPSGSNRPRRVGARWRGPAVAVGSAVVITAAVVWGTPLARDAAQTAPAAAPAAAAAPSGGRPASVPSTPSHSPTASSPAAPSVLATAPTPASPSQRPVRGAVTSVPTSTSPRSAGALLSTQQAQRLLSRLSQRRSAAFADPAADAGAVTVPGSPASGADGQALAALRRDGLAYRGLRLRVVVERVRALGAQVQVDATTSATGYAVVDRSGAVVGRVAAAPPQRVRLVLARVGSDWRVQQVA